MRHNATVAIELCRRMARSRLNSRARTIQSDKSHHVESERLLVNIMGRVDHRVQENSFYCMVCSEIRDLQDAVWTARSGFRQEHGYNYPLGRCVDCASDYDKIVNITFRQKQTG